MRALISTLLVISYSAVASAQGAPPAPQQPYPPAQQPYPPPQSYPPPQAPGQAYPQPYPQQPGAPQPGYGQPQVMPYQLTLDEQYLLERGFISDGEHIGGGLAAVFLGLGIGQAIQGRWSEKGYIFTLGEGASFVAMVWGLSRWANDCIDSETCRDDSGMALFAGGLIAFSVFRIWETIDAFVAPPEHNRKLRALRMRLGMPVPMYARVTPYVTSPKGDSGGAVAGLSLRF